MSDPLPLTRSDRSGSAPLERVPRPGRRELLAVGLLTVLAASLRLWDLGGQGLWYDEAWTLDLARSPLGLMLDRIPRWESTPPLYYLLAWFSVHLFGSEEWAVRLPAALAGVLTVPAVWAAGRALAGRAGLVAAAFAACSPFLWWYSQEARAYSLAALFCSLSLLFLGRALATRSWLDLGGWAASGALAMASQYPAGIVWAVSALVLALMLPGSRARIAAVSTVPIATGLALVPLAVEQRSSGRSDWIGQFPFGGRLEQIASQFWLGNPVFSSGRALDLAALGGLAAIVGLAVAARRRAGRLRPGVTVPAAVAVGTVLIVGLLAAAGTDMFLARNLIVAWPAAAVAVAGCVVAIGNRFAIWATTIVCVAMVGMIVVVSTDPDLQRNDFRRAASLLGEAPQGGRLVVFQAYPHSRPLTVYVDGLRRPGSESRSVTEVDVLSMDLPGPRWCWWGGVCSDGIRRGYASSPATGESFVGMRRVAVRRSGRFTLVVYRSGTPRPVSVGEIKRSLPERLHGLVLWQP